MPDAVWGVEAIMKISEVMSRNVAVGLLSLDDLAAKMSSDRLLGTVVRGVIAA
jgi:hypothetical protein